MLRSPLTGRGWAFQERFLAPRTLHFTKTQEYWEYRDKMACETYPDELPQATLYDIVERDQIESLWMPVITHYSKCQLTLPKDKLVAISGVAKWLPYRSKDEYVTGL